MKNFCEQCGSRLAADGRFCSTCGEPTGVTPALPPSRPDSMPVRRSRRSRRSWILALIAVVCLIATGFYFYPQVVKWVFGGGKIKPVTVQRSPDPIALRIASEASALALRSSVYAKLLHESLLLRLPKLSRAQAKTQLAELAQAWENAALAAQIADELCQDAIALTQRDVTGSGLRTVSLLQTNGLPPSVLSVGVAPARFAASGATAAKLATHGKITATTVKSSANGKTIARPAATLPNIDPRKWAEELTREYDRLRGPKRFQQLAKQLGTDARTAKEQMDLAQKIIFDDAMSEADRKNTIVKILQVTKTTSKVVMLGWASVATGGGSVALMEGTGLLVSGVDCIVDVVETGSTIVLGDNNNVAVAFGDIKERMGPVSSLIGLATMDPAKIGKSARETMEALTFITDSLVDLFVEDKIVGIKVEGLSNQATKITGEVFEKGALAAVRAAGYVLPDNPWLDAIDKMLSGWKPDRDEMFTRLDAISAQLAEIERNPHLFVSPAASATGSTTSLRPSSQLSSQPSSGAGPTGGAQPSATVPGGTKPNAGNDSDGKVYLDSWPDLFFGTAVPQPVTKGRITELFSKRNKLTNGVDYTIRIDGMTYEEYVAYCKVISALPGWNPDEEDNLANLPTVQPKESTARCSGSLGSISWLIIRYDSFDLSQKTELPQFMMFIYEKW